MTKKDRQTRLKKILLERKRKLWIELRDELFKKMAPEHHAQFETALDYEDQALLDLIEDTGLTIADIRREELTRMDETMRKLDEGTYGICEDCGEEISEERLKVMPYALYCVKCQEKHEGPVTRG
ncbi:MAG: TraR/DksA family transcriptional regulator [Deltaproteobacteria bacterium]|nr:TraR/DksA family transcriptional regulator [Deltaproteobacteria bacterium]